MTTKTKMVGRRLHGSENGLKDGERKPKTDRNGRMSLGTLRSNCEDRNAIEDFIENSCCELTNCDIVGRPYVFLRKVLPLHDRKISRMKICLLTKDAGTSVSVCTLKVHQQWLEKLKASVPE